MTSSPAVGVRRERPRRLFPRTFTLHLVAGLLALAGVGVGGFTVAYMAGWATVPGWLGRDDARFAGFAATVLLGVCVTACLVLVAARFSRAGVFTSPVGLVLDSGLSRRVLPWGQVSGARWDDRHGFFGCAGRVVLADGTRVRLPGVWRPPVDSPRPDLVVRVVDEVSRWRGWEGFDPSGEGRVELDPAHPPTKT